MNTQKQIFVMIVLLAIFTGGCAAYAAIDLPVRADRQADYFESESIERGALLYANNCRTCHGIRGQGGVGLALNTDAFKRQTPLVLQQNQELLRRTITCGRAGTVMPAWDVENGGSLSSHQIEHLVRLITAPLEEGVVDANGRPTNEGWLAAVEFAENLNHEARAVVGGDSLDSIALQHGIGPAELAQLNGLSVGATLEKGQELELPDGSTYKVGENDTIERIAARQHVGAMILAQLNDIDFVFDQEDARFYIPYDGSDERLVLDPESDVRATGLLPGMTLRLPDTATYTVVEGDTLESIAEAHGITAASLAAENGLEPDAGLEAEAVLDLPVITDYPVKVQSLEEVVTNFSGVSPAGLAEANGVEVDAELPAGKVLHLPEDAWGSAPPDTINDGSSCVEHALPPAVYDEITGASEPFVPTRPETVAEEVLIQAHANDWTFTVDGAAATPNEGVALIEAGTEVTFENVEGLHTITSNGEKQGDDISGTDVRTITFDTPGEYTITCDYHLAMFGVIYVE